MRLRKKKMEMQKLKRQRVTQIETYETYPLAFREDDDTFFIFIVIYWMCVEE